jgi:hypothetical protein
MIGHVVTDHLGAHEQDVARGDAEVATRENARAELALVRTHEYRPA